MILPQQGDGGGGDNLPLAVLAQLGGLDREAPGLRRGLEGEDLRGALCVAEGVQQGSLPLGQGIGGDGVFLGSGVRFLAGTGGQG